MKNIFIIAGLLLLTTTVFCQESTDVQETEAKPEKKVEKVESEHLLVKETMLEKSDEKPVPPKVEEIKKEEKAPAKEEEEKQVEKPKVDPKTEDAPVKEVKEVKEEAKTTTEVVPEKAKSEPTTTAVFEAPATKLPRLHLNRQPARERTELKVTKIVNEDVPQKHEDAEIAAVESPRPLSRIHHRKKPAAPREEEPEKESRKEEKEDEKTEERERPKVDLTTPEPMKPMRFIQNKNITPRVPNNRVPQEKQSRGPVESDAAPSEERAPVEEREPAKQVEGVRSEIRPAHPLSHKPLRRNTRMPDGKEAPPATNGHPTHRGNRQHRPPQQAAKPLFALRREPAKNVPVAKPMHRNQRKQSREERKPIPNTPANVPTNQRPEPAQIIVMRNGRVIPLTEQQQIDLDMIIAAMMRSRRRSRFH